MGRATAFLIACLISACGGPSDAVCPDADGTYLIHYAKKSGTCPDIPDVVETTKVGDSVPPGCVTAKNEPSADNCRADFDYTCTAQNGEIDRLVGYFQATSTTMDRIEGKITWYATLGSQGCVSTYDITMTRQ